VCLASWNVWAINRPWLPRSTPPQSDSIRLRRTLGLEFSQRACTNTLHSRSLPPCDAGTHAPRLHQGLRLAVPTRERESNHPLHPTTVRTVRHSVGVAVLYSLASRGIASNSWPIQIGIPRTENDVGRNGRQAASTIYNLAKFRIAHKPRGDSPPGNPRFVWINFSHSENSPPRFCGFSPPYRIVRIVRKS
jgi:hypothetical protein